MTKRYVRPPRMNTRYAVNIVRMSASCEHAVVGVVLGSGRAPRRRHAPSLREARQEDDVLPEDDPRVVTIDVHRLDG